MFLLGSAERSVGLLINTLRDCPASDGLSLEQLLTATFPSHKVLFVLVQASVLS